MSQQNEDPREIDQNSMFKAMLKNFKQLEVALEEVKGRFERLDNRLLELQRGQKMRGSKASTQNHPPPKSQHVELGDIKFDFLRTYQQLKSEKSASKCQKDTSNACKKERVQSTEMKVDDEAYFEASSSEEKRKDSSLCKANKEELPACLELNKEKITCEETKFKECLVQDDIVEEVDFNFPFPLDIQIKHSLDLRTNPFQEEGNDMILVMATSDPNKVPTEFVVRTRATEFEEGINGLVQRFWAQTNSWRPIELSYSKWGLFKVFQQLTCNI